MKELIKCPFCLKEFLRNLDLYNHVKSKKFDGIHNLDVFFEGTKELKKVFKFNNTTEINEESVNLLEQIAKNENINLSKRISSFLKAAQLRTILNQTRHVDYNYANYYFLKGKIELNSEKFSEALNCFSKSFLFFRKLGIEELVSVVDNYRLKILSIKRKSLDLFENEDDYQDNLQMCFEILDRYENNFESKLRIIHFPSVLMDKIWFHRKHNEYEIAKNFAEERLNFALQLLEKRPNSPEYNKLKVSSLKMLLECSGKELKQRVYDYKILADFYADSAKKMENQDFYYYAELWSEYYKYKALEKLKNNIQFKKNIDLAIEWAKKAKSSIEYLESLRFNRLERYTIRNPQININLLESKKSQLFKEGKNEEGYEVLIEIELLKARYAEHQCDFKQARNYLLKALKILKKPRIYSFYTDSDKINNQLLLINFKDAFSNQNYSNALSFLGVWLENEKDQENSYTHLRNQLYYHCTKLLEKERNSIGETDLKNLENFDKKSIENYKKLIKYLKDYIHLCSSTVVDDKQIQDQIIKITKKVVGGEIASEMRRIAILETFLTEMTWIETYPAFLQEKYRKIFLFFNDLIPSSEMFEAALQQLYKLLEKILEIFIECQSKLVWGRRWNDQIEQKTSKNIDRLTFGEYIKLFHDIFEEQQRDDISLFRQMCKNDKNIKDALGLLDEHVIIRNSITHNFTQLNSTEAKKYFNEITQIIFLIHNKFPVCAKIESSKGNKYQIEMIWNKYPKFFHIYITSRRSKLKEDFYYYLFPREIFEDKKYRILSPKIILGAFFLPKQLNLIREPNNLIIFSANDLKKIRKLIFDLIQNSTENFQVNQFLQAFMPTQDIKDVVTAFLSVYGYSYVNLTINEENFFLIPAQVFNKCLAIIQELFGPNGVNAMVSFYNLNLSKSFKNLIFGNKIGKSIYPPTQYIFPKREFLDDLLHQFRNLFARYGVKTPTVEDVLISCIENIQTVQNAVRVLSLLGLSPEEINHKMQSDYKFQDWSTISLKFGCSSIGGTRVICKALFYYTILRSNFGNLLIFLTSSLRFMQKIIDGCSFIISLEEPLLTWISSAIIKIILDPDFECEWTFNNKQDILDFIEICKNSMEDLGFNLGKTEDIYQNFLKKCKKKRNNYIKIDKIIQGPLTELYEALLTENLNSTLIHNFLTSDTGIENFDSLWNAFMDILKLILLENNCEITLHYLKDLIDYLNVCSDFIIFKIETEGLIDRIVNLVCSMIINDRGKWGINFQIENKLQFEELIKTFLDFFYQFGFKIPSLDLIKKRILKEMAPEDLQKNDFLSELNLNSTEI